jgi:hypothetical protein
MFLILEPIARVFSPQFSSFIAPISTLSMATVSTPHAFILIAILVELDAEPIFAVVFPITYVS